MKVLVVYLQERVVGRLEQDESGRLGFAYEAEWLDDEEAIPLSQSLTLRAEPFDHRATRPFFAGLLPEGSARERVARVLGTSPRSDFALLERLGAECAGAVSLLPPGEKPASSPASYEPLTEADLAELLDSLPKRPLLAGERGVRLSLAGSQDKLALARLPDGTFALPREGAPSSHVLKTEIHPFADTVVNEAFCLELSRRMGIPAARAEVERVGRHEVLVVERYDRVRVAESGLRRLHQEDVCQALAVTPEDKYEADGGPSLPRIFDLLARVASRPARDRLHLLDAVVFDLLVGNHDAHGKNFSLLTTGRGIELAPRYDVLSTAVYSELSGRLAMKIGGEDRPDRIYRPQLERLATDAGLAVPQTVRQVEGLARHLPAEAQTLRDVYAGRGLARPILDAICRVVEVRCSRLLGVLGTAAG